MLFVFILSSMFRMRFLIIVLITTFSCFSQKNEIGFHFGGNNYIGEIGNTQYINPNKIYNKPMKDLKEKLSKLINRKILKKNGIIIMHRHKKDKLEINKKIKILDVRNYGVSKVYFCN